MKLIEMDPVTGEPGLMHIRPAGAAPLRRLAERGTVLMPVEDFGYRRLVEGRLVRSERPTPPAPRIPDVVPGDIFPEPPGKNPK